MLIGVAMAEDPPEQQRRVSGRRKLTKSERRKPAGWTFDPTFIREVQDFVYNETNRVKEKTASEFVERGIRELMQWYVLENQSQSDTK
jgi:hypothetical protein